MRAPEARTVDTPPDARTAMYSSMRDFVMPALKLPKALSAPEITPTTCIYPTAFYIVVATSLHLPCH